MRILNLDIEVAPALAWIWDLRVRYISPDKIVQPKKMLCFAGKWVGEDDVYFFSEWDDGHEEMICRIREVLDEADAVLHYNGRRFDVPYINTEFALAHLPPPSPYAQIDLMKAVQKNFAFMSHSLDFVTRQLGTTAKLGNEGFALWTKVMDGDARARRQMEDYNIGDVFANEDLYKEILPWIPAHPNYQLTSGSGCSQCGSCDVEENGVAYTAVSAYTRYLCRSCGRWMRGSKRIAGAELRGV
jgi:RNase_H superfamily